MQRDSSLSSRSEQAGAPEFIGASPLLSEIIALAKQAADVRAPILLQGESGVGKALLANAIHRWSRRAAGPFFHVHCGSSDESEQACELFGVGQGHECKGDRDGGIWRAAGGGTLFLEEIHAAGPSLQTQMLRAMQLQNASSPRNSSPATDVRVIASSSRDLVAEVEAGRFREDLYWRLSVIPIYIPPLRRRREDIAPLAEYWMRVFAEANQRPVEKISPAALAALQQYAWPGNIPELQNYIERGVILAQKNELTLECLPGVVSGQQTTQMGAFRGADPQALIAEFVHNEIAAANGDGADLHARIVNPVERELILQVMQQCNNVQKKAADRLGMNRNTLHKKLKDYGIE